MANLTAQQLIQKAGKLHSSGKYNQAEKIYRQLLKANPNDLTLLRVLGMLERDRRDLKAAINWFTLAKQLSGNNPVILAELALTLEQAGKADKAMELAKEAQSNSPNDLAIAIFFAKMCLARGHASQACAAIDQAIDSDPNNPEAWHLLSIAVNSSGVLPIPLHFAQKLIQLQPQEAQPQATLATSHRLNGDVDRALVSYDRAISMDPTLNEAIAGKAEVLISLGHLDEADALLADVPETDSILISLAKVRIAREQQTPEVALKVIDRALTPRISPHHTSNLLMHRGRVLEELAKYDEAWASWEKGNTLHAGKFDLEAHINVVDSIIDAPISNSGLSNSTQPIFIVGMYRSGTTLLEQILGAHPEIDAAGEVNQILRYANDMPYPECISSPNQEWPEQYLKRLNSDNKHCTDKMPMNYLHIGLINAIFPNATIIHTTRNPLDTCVSCFANSFTASHAYTADLKDLSAVYAQYQRIMSHWNEVLQGRIYEVSYETLIHNFEDTITGALSHIGVDYDKAVLEFYNVRRIALTPSADQVRKPIYDSSIDRHKNFKRHLGELTSLQ